MDFWKKSKDKVSSAKDKEEQRKAEIKYQLQKAIEKENRKDAIRFIKQHNKVDPAGKLILHGTYSRTIHVWCDQIRCMLSLKVRITRIRSKKQNKTFSYQGGLFIIRARYGGKFLLGILARLVQRSGKTFEDVCYDMDLPPRSARLYLKRLRDFLGKTRLTEIFADTPAEKAPGLFIGQMWHTEGNPFCSPMEAAL